MARRTQTQRSDATTAQLIDAARRLFGQDGYAATSIDAVTAGAGGTKGAAYHHFANKEALFRAVFVQEQAETAHIIERAAAAAPDTWTALRAGCRMFLEHCVDPPFQRIV